MGSTRQAGWERMETQLHTARLTSLKSFPWFGGSLLRLRPDEERIPGLASIELEVLLRILKNNNNKKKVVHYVYERLACLCVCAPRECLVPAKVQKGRLDPPAIGCEPVSLYMGHGNPTSIFCKNNGVVHFPITCPQCW